MLFRSAAYTRCERNTKESSATFHFATLLMRREQRRSVQAIYAWCRELDETVDGVEALESPKEDADVKLRAIERDLRAMFAEQDRATTTGAPGTRDATAAPETIALADTIRRTPGLESAPFLDMIEGMRQDLAVTVDASASGHDALTHDLTAEEAAHIRDRLVAEDSHEIGHFHLGGRRLQDTHLDLVADLLGALLALQPPELLALLRRQPGVDDAHPLQLGDRKSVV